MLTRKPTAGIWSSANPTISCIPPCIYILPPITLSTITTITFPLYTTSLEVAWKTTSVTTLPGGQVSTITVYDRTTVKTTLTLPPMTTNQIDVWNVNITAGVTGSLLTVTRSILPPPFTITDSPNPRSEPGVTHPPVHRTITPPPFPHIAPKPTSSQPGDIPPLSHTSKAPPGPTCKSGCGSKCKYFCVGPCLLDCVDPPGGFRDPIDPNPGPPPGPGPHPKDANGDGKDGKCQSPILSSYCYCGSNLIISLPAFAPLTIRSF